MKKQYAEILEENKRITEMKGSDAREKEENDKELEEALH